MRICRFDDHRLGVVVGEEVVDVTPVASRLPVLAWPTPPGDHFVRHLDAMRAEIERIMAGSPRKPLRDVRLLSPVANPGKIIGAPVNYMLHLQESRADAGINFGTDVKTIDHYGLFLKASSSLVGPSEGVVSKRSDRRTDHEIELALVIGRGGRNISEAEALSHVAGYVIGLDMTIRGTEDRSYRKSLDTFSVLGPWMVTADEFGDPAAVDFELKVNGETRQRANTRDLIFDVPKLISYASHAYRLDPGDVIMTGTPQGVGPVEPGDVMDCWIDGIGAMQVAVRGP
jgi:2-keto-4-pentenoate hydratase/2-oxohepta-3-ene-1,7-dioic acid hydratase in catechol pathway